MARRRKQAPSSSGNALAGRIHVQTLQTQMQMQLFLRSCIGILGNSRREGATREFVSAFVRCQCRHENDDTGRLDEVE